MPDIGLLALLGWYLVVLHTQDTLNTTAATVPVLA
jgi:hypothetical protein